MTERVRDEGSSEKDAPGDRAAPGTAPPGAAADTPGTTASGPEEAGRATLPV
jgi:hypothetical protein